MTIESTGGGVMFAGRDAVEVFRLISIKHALRLEALGMKHSRGSVYARVKREFGLHGNKQSVSDQFAVLSERLIAEARARDAAATATQG